VTGQYIVTPDNGSLSHIARVIGIEEVREISKDERRAGSQFTQTFHGRDVYAYIGARLAAGIRKFEEIGEAYDVKDVVMLEMPEAKFENGVLTGTIETLDVRFGSLWTNISSELFARLGAERKDLIDISIYNGDRKVHRSFVTYALTFADVEIGESLIYVNSMNHMAVAINQGSFADAYHIGTRNGWKITIKKASDR
jgi:S-adenosylmethionine hydrolase